jgi:hypothetical protein
MQHNNAAQRAAYRLDVLMMVPFNPATENMCRDFTCVVLRRCACLACPTGVRDIRSAQTQPGAEHSPDIGSTAKPPKKRHVAVQRRAAHAAPHRP